MRRFMEWLFGPTLTKQEWKQMVREMREADAANIRAFREEERAMRQQWREDCREMRRARP